jgi:CBS domain-containing protein
MSPRAALRLESLGFEQVYDYVAGKYDWAAFGLPIEGKHHSGTRVGAHARTNTPACGLRDRLREVRERVRGAGWDTCFVTDERGIVLGRLGRAALAREDEVSVEGAMTAGPSTVRPSFRLDQAVERMQSQKLTNLPVTRSDGVLIGVIRRIDAEQALM